MTETSQGSQPIQTDQGGIQEDSIATQAFGPNTVAHSLKRGRCSMDMEADCENDLPFLHQKLYAIAKAQEMQYLAVFDYWVNEKKSEIDAQDSSGKIALHIAIELHLTLEAKCLVRGGADVTIRDFDGRQPIYLACIGRQTEMVHFLLTKVKDVNALCNKKETLLASACKMGQLDIVNLLLENRNRPIEEVAYDLGPIEVVGTAIRNLLDKTTRGSTRFNNSLYAKENLKLTWVHLPSTNMVWMNDLLTTIMSHERYRTRDYYKVRSFFRDSWVEVPDKESRSRMMRSRSVIRPMEDATELEPKEEQTTESNSTTAKDGDENDSGGSETIGEETRSADSEDQKIHDDWISKSDQLPKKPPGFVPASAIYVR